MTATQNGNRSGPESWDFDALLERAQASERPEEAYDIRIARDGTWFHNGAPVGREALMRLFASVLHRAEDGQYWLVTPSEYGRIEVEEVPFIALEMQREGEGDDQILRFRTNAGDWFTLDDEHPLFFECSPVTGELTPYLRVRGRLTARLARPVYYDLVALAVPLGDAEAEDPEALGVWSAGSCFPLGAS